MDSAKFPHKEQVQRVSFLQLWRRTRTCRGAFIRKENPEEGGKEVGRARMSPSSCPQQERYKRIPIYQPLLGRDSKKVRRQPYVSREGKEE